MDVRPAASNPAGYVVVLLGVAGFVVSCFLPFYGGPFLPADGAVSLYRLIVRTSAMTGEQLGGVLYLFAGAATVGVISLIGLGRPRTRTPHVLVAGAAAWTLTWLGVLLGQSGFAPHEVGYWAAYASLGVAVVGTIVVWVSSRSRDREPEPTPA